MRNKFMLYKPLASDEEKWIWCTSGGDAWCWRGKNQGGRGKAS